MPQRRQTFGSCKGDNKKFEKLIDTGDNITRWNSAYEMIRRAIKLQYRLQQFCSELRSEIEEDWPCEEDWQLLHILEELLRPCH